MEEPQSRGTDSVPEIASKVNIGADHLEITPRLLLHPNGFVTTLNAASRHVIDRPRVLGEQVGLEAANEILEEAGFEFVEKDTDLDSQALRVGSVGSV